MEYESNRPENLVEIDASCVTVGIVLKTISHVNLSGITLTFVILSAFLFYYVAITVIVDRLAARGVYYGSKPNAKYHFEICVQIRCILFSSRALHKKTTLLSNRLLTQLRSDLLYSNNIFNL